MKNFFKLKYQLLVVASTMAWDSFESAVWNYLQKDKSKRLSPFEEKVHNFLFNDQLKTKRGVVVQLDEIQEFDEKDFAEYNRYDNAYPDRFVAKYDANHNRIW
jgi:hypothetical protein